LTQPNKHIIQGCKKGNRASQKELYFLSKDRIKSIALRYCYSIEDAKDVVQESYLKIYKNIKSLDDSKGSFNAWSAKIVVNEALTKIRKKKHADLYVNSMGDDNYSKQKPSLDNITIEEIKKTMKSLKGDHQLVLNMYFFEEFNYKEMSSILKLKESSVRSKVTRAKSELMIHWRKKT